MTSTHWGMVTSCVMIAFGCGGRHIDSRSQTESGHDAGVRRTGAGGSCATSRFVDMTFAPGSADPDVSYHLTVSNWASLGPNDEHYPVRVVFGH